MRLLRIWLRANRIEKYKQRLQSNQHIAWAAELLANNIGAQGLSVGDPRAYPADMLRCAGGQARGVLGSFTQVERGSKVLERIRIWTDESKTVHYELTAIDGTICDHTAIPAEEWEAMRQNMIESILKIEDTYNSIQDKWIPDLIDYIAVMADIRL